MTDRTQTNRWLVLVIACVADLFGRQLLFVAGGGGAVGLVVGGFLTDVLSWRWRTAMQMQRMPIAPYIRATLSVALITQPPTSLSSRHFSQSFV